VEKATSGGTPLNVTKCKVVSYGHHIDSVNDYYVHSNGSVSVLEHLYLYKNLGVTFDSGLKFNLLIAEKVNKAYSVLGLIHSKLKYLSTNTLVMLYKT